MRIMVVEDHRDTRQVLARLLEHWGFEVVTAEDLESSLSFLDVGRFGAIVSDIALPDGTGYALIKEAKQREHDLLGVAVSAYASPNDVSVGRLAGFDHYLTKPVDCHQLRSILEQRTQTVS